MESPYNIKLYSLKLKERFHSTSFSQVILAGDNVMFEITVVVNSIRVIFSAAVFTITRYQKKKKLFSLLFSLFRYAHGWRSGLCSDGHTRFAFYSLSMQHNMITKLWQLSEDYLTKDPRGI